MGDALQSLENSYLFLTSNLSGILNSCQNQSQKDAVMSQYVEARRNYWNCVNSIFHDDDPAVAALVSQLKTDQTSLQAAVKSLANISNVIDAITTAVKAASDLAAKVG